MYHYDHFFSWLNCKKHLPTYTNHSLYRNLFWQYLPLHCNEPTGMVRSGVDFAIEFNDYDYYMHDYTILTVLSIILRLNLYTSLVISSGLSVNKRHGFMSQLNNSFNSSSMSLALYNNQFLLRYNVTGIAIKLVKDYVKNGSSEQGFITDEVRGYMFCISIVTGS